jgi:hypothetical protein
MRDELLLAAGFGTPLLDLTPLVWSILPSQGDARRLGEAGSAMTAGIGETYVHDFSDCANTANEPVHQPSGWPRWSCSRSEAEQHRRWLGDGGTVVVISHPRGSPAG